jgi:hypothetical protein
MTNVLHFCSLTSSERPASSHRHTGRSEIVFPAAAAGAICASFALYIPNMLTGQFLTELIVSEGCSFLNEEFLAYNY